MAEKQHAGACLHLMAEHKQLGCLYMLHDLMEVGVAVQVASFDDPSKTPTPVLLTWCSCRPPACTSR
jgi:hypothetical protein